jgi:8-oxo-dGTP pyrophosphatase MutT (NUDIX family)
MRRFLFNAAKGTILHPWLRITRGMTLGVRVAAIEGERVMLVRHTYSPGWLLPGGGVDRGETVFDAARRELREECGIETDETPQLHGLYSNESNFPGDHVACLIVRKFSRGPWRPSLEISEASFFNMNDLPAGTTEGTRRRIAEMLGQRPVSADW